MKKFICITLVFFILVSSSITTTAAEGAEAYNLEIAGTVYVAEQGGIAYSSKSRYAEQVDIMIETVDAANNLYRIGAYVYMGALARVERINMPYVYGEYDEPGGLSFYTDDPGMGDTIFMWSSFVVYLEPGTHYVTFSQSSYVEYYDMFVDLTDPELDRDSVRIHEAVFNRRPATFIVVVPTA